MDRSTIWPLIKQLAKEFWFPAMMATAWVIYGVISKVEKASFSNTVTRFGAAFFFFSWATSQVFRVSKQSRAERSLAKLETGVQNLLTDMRAETERLRNVVTGGRSFCYFVFLYPETDAPLVFAAHEGDDPLYNVQARMVDLRKFNAIPDKTTLASINSTESYFEIGDMTAGFGTEAGRAATFQGTEHNYNIFFTARNGGWSQVYRARKVDGKWLSATLVTKQGQSAHAEHILLKKVDDGFPSDALPAQWTTGLTPTLGV